MSILKSNGCNIFSLSLAINSAIIFHGVFFKVDFLSRYYLNDISRKSRKLYGIRNAHSRGLCTRDNKGNKHACLWGHQQSWNFCLPRGRSSAAELTGPSETRTRRTRQKRGRGDRWVVSTSHICNSCSCMCVCSCVCHWHLALLVCATGNSRCRCKVLMELTKKKVEGKEKKKSEKYAKVRAVHCARRSKVCYVYVTRLLLKLKLEQQQEQEQGEGEGSGPCAMRVM